MASEFSSGIHVFSNHPLLEIIIKKKFENVCEGKEMRVFQSPGKEGILEPGVAGLISKLGSAVKCPLQRPPNLVPSVSRLIKKVGVWSQRGENLPVFFFFLPLKS